MRGKSEPPSDLTCHVTGLPVLCRPEWTDVCFSKDYRTKVSLVGSQILLNQPSGHVTGQDAEKAFRLGFKALTEGTANRPYVHIEDCSNLEGGTAEAGRCYMDYMKKGESSQLLGFICFGLSPELKMAMKLDRTCDIGRPSIHIVKDYSEAVRLALRMLATEKTCPKGQHPAMRRKDDTGRVSPVVVTDPDWRLDVDGFSVRCEVIDGKILHSICTGYLEERHVEAITRLRERVRKATIPSGSFDYIVVDVTSVTGGSRRARRLYMNALKQWHDYQPFRMYVFYGVGAFMRAAANLARPFMPFNVETAEDLDSALALIHQEEGKSIESLPPSTAGDMAGMPLTSYQMQKNIDDLLYVLGSIDWETDGFDGRPQVDPSHPFWPAFDAIALVKGELDDLLQERKRAEDELRKSEERYRILIEKSPSAISMIGKDGRYRYINPKFVEIFGYSLEDIPTGREWFEKAFPDPEDRSEVVSAWVTDLKESKPGEVRPRTFNVTCKDGSRKVIYFRPVTLESGDQFVFYEDISERHRVEQALERARDNLEIRVAERASELIRANELLQNEIEERKRAEKALRESIERFRETADLLPTIICEMDTDLRVTYVNNLGLRTLGYSQADIDAGVHVMDVIHPDDEKMAAQRIERLMRGDKLDTAEYRLLRKDGSEVISLFNSSAIHKEGRFVGIRTSITDVTELRRLERQFQQAQKMEAVGTLAGGIAHDFNNLLMGIQGRVSLMLMGMDDDHPYFTHVSGIEEAVKRGAYLAKQLLGFARGGKYEVKPTDLNDLLSKSSEMLGRAKKEIRIHRKYQKDIWTVETDRGQIEQVLLNLYVNAWQAMPEGGDLYLETKNVNLDEKYTEAFHIEPGSYVKISVTDTGVGMDEITRERVFEPFFTTKEMGEGTGLGLASAYGIINNHGGIIDVYSEPGHGATFSIYLPASDKKITRDKKPSADLLKGKETVLLVDDEHMVLDVGKEMLTALGYKVMVAADGKQAVELYEKNQDKIDMVILDLIMPDMGGGEVYDKLKEMSPKIKILLSSGYSIDGQANEILRRGCDGFIQKPFNIKELSARLRDILEKG